MIGSGPADSGSIPPVSPGRRSRILPAPDDRRAFLIAIVSTVVVFGVIGFVIVNSSGWPRFQQSFFDSET